MAPVMALDIDCEAIDSITAKLRRRRRDTLAERPKLAPERTLTKIEFSQKDQDRFARLQSATLPRA